MAQACLESLISQLHLRTAVEIMTALLCCDICALAASALADVVVQLTKTFVQLQPTLIEAAEALSRTQAHLPSFIGLQQMQPRCR